MNQRQRIMPTDSQIEVARSLLEGVPALSYDWASASGQQFLAYVHKLTDNGVPIAWIAEPLGMDVQRLYGTLARYRKGKSA